MPRPAPAFPTPAPRAPARLRYRAALLRRSLVLIALLAFPLAAALGCTAGPGGSTHRLSFDLGAEPKSLDPQRAIDLHSFNVLNATLEGLVRLGEGGRIEHGLADRWEVSEDGLTYTFHLREATWQDGRPIVADDFVQAWRRAIDPRTGAPYAFQFHWIEGAKEANEAVGDPAIDTALGKLGVRALDPRTLEVRLVAPAPFWLQLTAFPSYLPTQPEALARHGSRYGSSPETLAASGPYRVVEWQHDGELLLRPNPTYWDRKAVRLEELRLVIASDMSARASLYESGELDAADLTGDHALVYRARGELRSVAEATLGFIEVNTRRPALADPRARQALSLAIDRGKLIEAARGDGSEPATAVTPPSLQVDGEAYHERVGDPIPPTADPAAARALWAEVHPRGEAAAPVRLSLLVEDADVARRQAEALQAMWREALGLEVQVELAGFNALLDRLHAGEYDLAAISWIGDYADPLTFLDLWVGDSPFNDAGWRDERYDELIAGSNTARGERRAELLAEAERLLLSPGNLPILPLYWPSRTYVERPHVRGVIRHPVGASIEWKWARRE